MWLDDRGFSSQFFRKLHPLKTCPGERVTTPNLFHTCVAFENFIFTFSSSICNSIKEYLKSSFFAFFAWNYETLAIFFPDVVSWFQIADYHDLACWGPLVEVAELPNFEMFFALT